MPLNARHRLRATLASSGLVAFDPAGRKYHRRAFASLLTPRDVFGSDPETIIVTYLNV